MKRFVLFLLAPALAVSWLTGCGGGDVPRHDVSGSVTFGGQLVPAGTILFGPDTAQGGSGPAGTAIITGGRYDTSANGGSGTVGGPHIVVISGYDGQYADEQPQGMRLFPPYEQAVDLPRAATTLDFEVPQPK